MRPIMLDLNGFASFREPARVDFTDADFFALVGPTGSGKSTVIDAMTFALYGSVPRWGRKNMVSLALAPTVARGTVKLVFEVEDQRYAVARELRRAGRQVTQRAASLERLRSRDGLAEPGEQTDVLAKDLAGVTDAVERLLGLSYEDFCQCVVLPQGQFANFLHAKSSERQEILLRLLGAEHYRQMMMRANQRATLAAQRADTLTETLSAFTGATPQAEAAARAAELNLAGLSERVTAARPQIQAADTEVAAAGAELTRLQDERITLAAVRIPDDAAALDANLGASRSAAEQAQAAEKTAELADRAAREALTNGPQRAPLELARERRIEHGELGTRRPLLETEAARLSTLAAQAETAVSDGLTSLEKLRAQRDEAARSAEAAQRREHDLNAEHAALAAIAVPDGAPQLDEHHRTATAAAGDASAALLAAEQADSEARQARDSAIAPGPLEQALRDLRELGDLIAGRPATWAALDHARSQRAAAEAALDSAEAAARQRQQDVDQARRAHVAADLRPHLVTGQPCPVCEQPVATLPAPLPAPAIGAAQARLDQAAQTVTTARETARTATAAELKAAAALDSLSDQQAHRIAALSTALAGPLAGASLPQTAALVSQTAETTQRTTVASPAAGIIDPAQETQVAATVTEADANLQTRNIQDENANASSADVIDPAQKPRAATALTEVGASLVASGSLDENANASAADIDPVPGARADAAVAEVGTSLQARRQLDENANASVAAVETARGRARSAQNALDERQAQLAAARSALRAARDPLVGLGAPAFDDSSLAAAWASLAGWAAGQAQARAAELTEASQDARLALSQRDQGEAEFGRGEAELSRLRAAALSAAKTEQEASARLAEVTRRITELEQLLRDAPGESEIVALLAFRNDLEIAASDADQRLLTARAGRDSAERALSELERAEAVARGRLSGARDLVVKLGAPALDDTGLLAGWTALATWAGREASARERDAGPARERLSAAGANLAQLTGQLSKDLAAGGVELAPEEVAANASSAVAGALAGAQAETKRIAERRSEAADLTARRDAALDEQRVARLLGDLLRSDRFPRWLVSAAVDALVTDASAKLAGLSDGQFDLTHEDGEFYVIDHTDADSRRSVRTLSGGETFQASLALALALSSQMSALSAAGAARLDSIFLDEGFGTLDPDTLEVVASTLETLAQGQRMVGVITHVAALAERVPVRFMVSRDARTSSVTRETAPAAGAA